jgi:lipid-A-disaccharide synthase-like uncharacterized protein
MNQELLRIASFVLTPMKLIGLTGTILFGGRWLVQYYASRRAGRPTVPRVFWYMSLVGTVFQLAYFVFGKMDAVGIVGNVFPAFVAAYNLYLDVTHQRRAASTV